MNQGAIEQEMLEESDNEFTKGEITEGEKKRLAFLEYVVQPQHKPRF